MKIKVVWDTSDDECDVGPSAEDCGLPEIVEVPDDIDEDDIADWLSDGYGFCVYSIDYV
jgi:hypothetical protein